MGCFAREVDYLASNEWACSAEDILWRRTKLGLFTSAGEQQVLADYLQREQQARTQAA